MRKNLYLILGCVFSFLIGVSNVSAYTFNSEISTDVNDYNIELRTRNFGTKTAKAYGYAEINGFPLSSTDYYIRMVDRDAAPLVASEYNLNVGTALGQHHQLYLEPIEKNSLLFNIDDDPFLLSKDLYVYVYNCVTEFRYGGRLTGYDPYTACKTTTPVPIPVKKAELPVINKRYSIDTTNTEHLHLNHLYPKTLLNAENIEVKVRIGRITDKKLLKAIIANDSNAIDSLVDYAKKALIEVIH